VRRREAEFRAKMVLEFLDRGERNTYLHILREERAALIKREPGVVRRPRGPDAQARGRGREGGCSRPSSARIRGSLVMEAHFALRALACAPREGAGPRRRRRARPQSRAASSPTTSTPRPSASTGSPLHAAGLGLAPGRPAVTAVRVNLGGRLFDGRHGLEEPEVVEAVRPPAGESPPGLRGHLRDAPGRHSLSLEAQLEGGRVALDHATSIWCEPRGR
jgi:hypothetical protein